MVLFWNKITQVWQVRKLDFVNFVLQFNLRISPNKFGLTWLWGKKRNPKPQFTDWTANITNSKYYQINWDKRTKVLLKSYKTEHFQAHLTFHWEGKKQRKKLAVPNFSKLVIKRFTANKIPSQRHTTFFLDCKLFWWIVSCTMNCLSSDHIFSCSPVQAGDTTNENLKI